MVASVAPIYPNHRQSFLPQAKQAASYPVTQIQPRQQPNMQQQEFYSEVKELMPLFCRALYDYQAQDVSALSFSCGDIMEVITQEPSGWWDGVLRDERGWFPSNYVEVISQQEAEQAFKGSDKTEALIARIHAIFLDVELYKVLLKYEGSKAQTLLDTFQWLLDRPTSDNEFRRHLVVATQRLARKSKLYPTCYELKNIIQDGQIPLEAGGFADIYKGFSEGETVCLKAIRVYQSTQIDYLIKKISQESILWGQLDHKNVLPFYGLFRFNGRLCFVSPWMEAGHVRIYLTKNPKADRARLVFEVAEGLQYLHQNGIVHGDLKGANILIDNEGRARLADFGLSSMSDSEILAWTSASSMSSRGGSVRWQAPELFDVDTDNFVKNTTESDVYAWSCVCFEIFTGTLPFADIQRESTIELKIMNGTRPSKPHESSPSWHEWGLTMSIWSLMEECWDQNPSNRPEIPQIIARLKSRRNVLVKQDTNDTSEMSSVRFRQRMHNPIDTTAVSLILDRDLSFSHFHPTGTENHIRLGSSIGYNFVAIQSHSAEKSDKKSGWAVGASPDIASVDLLGHEQDKVALPSAAVHPADTNDVVDMALARESKIDATLNHARGLKPDLIPVSDDDHAEYANKVAHDSKPWWYLRPTYSPEDILIDLDNTVKGGSLPAFVERLTAHDQVDPTFNKAFLMTFKSFTTVNELFDLLVARFRLEPPPDLKPEELEDWGKQKKHLVQIRVINTFVTMLKDDDILEKEDFHILERIRAFMSSDEVSQFGAAKQVLIHIDRAIRNDNNALKAMPQSTPPPPIYPKTTQKLKLADIEPLELARQLTIIESNLYQKIKPMECLQRAREQRTENMDNIATVIQMSNRIADWVADCVLSKEDSRKRASTVKHLISVADRCRTLNNFSSMIAITSGLNTPPIRRLKRTWEQVNQRSMAQFTACEMTIDSNKNFTKYRQLMASVTPPCVPFIGVFLSTLHFIQDGNPDMLPGGLVNFRKRQKASEVINDIKRWQAQPFNLQPIPAVQAFIEESLNQFIDSKASSEQFWTLEREPRDREDEKMARLLQESGFL